MARGKRKQIDPLAKRRDETHLQWRARIAREQETRRSKGDDIVTPERLAKGDLQPALSPDQERAKTYRKRSTSSLARLCARGALTPDQLAAAQEIAVEATRIGGDVGYASGSVEARVDCGNSGKTYGAEHLHRVCMERAYTEWRCALRHPRGMVLDMLTEDHRLAAIAARYGRNWRIAMDALQSALNVWPQYKREAFQGITQDDVDRANQRAA